MSLYPHSGLVMTNEYVAVDDRKCVKSSPSYVATEASSSSYPLSSLLLFNGAEPIPASSVNGEGHLMDSVASVAASVGLSKSTAPQCICAHCTRQFVVSACVLALVT